MDLTLAALFYIGIIVPTFVTIFVFVGFLICLYRRNIQRKMSRQFGRALPATPTSLGQTSTKRKSFEKFDKCSQHSADSAIDVGEVETSLEEKIATSGMVLDVKSLGKNNHSYQNDAMQLTTEAEIHSGRGTLTKGYYPSHEKLNEEIHSQVKIYEKMSDVQRVALQLQQKSESAEKPLIAPAMNNLQLDENNTSRYTSTSKLVPGACVPKSNQLDEPSNYASYSPSWFTKHQSANLYDSQYPSAAYWQPNIAASCSSNTDNYSSMESSQV